MLFRVLVVVVLFMAVLPLTPRSGEEPALYRHGACRCLHIMRAASRAVNGTVRAGTLGGMVERTGASSPEVSPSAISGSSPSTASRTPRRRGEERTRQLLEVTLEIAAEAGYHGLTIEAVARRAGVGKHTIYRRWSSIAELLLDALNHVWISDLDYHRSGEIRADLREQFLRSSRALSTPPIGPIYRAVIAEAQADPALRVTLHTRFLATVERRTLDRITLAQRNGELDPQADLEIAAEVLAGTLYYRWLLTPRPIDEQAVDGIIDLFLSAWGSTTP
ncbi:MAG TPA: TetR/AcrR family transcriptional regulator [Segeticoccus sp.]|nr:TetR/AcrR family transcriptional regulator [Segeticoccus sp.]